MSKGHGMSTSIQDYLIIKHLCKDYALSNNTVNILSDVNISIHKGETVAVLGESGSGKSTLLRLMAGLEMPTSGSIIIENQSIEKKSENERAQFRLNHIGFIFQSFNLLSSLTAIENVALPLEIKYLKNKIVRERAMFWLDKVGLAGKLHYYPDQLSGGEQQRVAIARAFISEPPIILADEMTGNLDYKTGSQIADLVFSLNQDNKTTFCLVTHDKSLANMCHVRYCMANGTLQPC